MAAKQEFFTFILRMKHFHDDAKRVPSSTCNSYVISGIIQFSAVVSRWPSRLIVSWLNSYSQELFGGGVGVEVSLLPKWNWMIQWGWFYAENCNQKCLVRVKFPRLQAHWEARTHNKIHFITHFPHYFAATEMIGIMIIHFHRQKGEEKLSLNS